MANFSGSKEAFTQPVSIKLFNPIDVFFSAGKQSVQLSGGRGEDVQGWTAQASLPLHVVLRDGQHLLKFGCFLFPILQQTCELLRLCSALQILLLHFLPLVLVQTCWILHMALRGNQVSSAVPPLLPFMSSSFSATSPCILI